MSRTAPRAPSRIVPRTPPSAPLRPASSSWAPTDQLANWPVGQLVGQSGSWAVGHLVSWPVGKLLTSSWPAGQAASWSAVVSSGSCSGQLASRQVDWPAVASSTGQLVSWPADQLSQAASWPVGQLVNWRSGQLTTGQQCWSAGPASQLFDWSAGQLAN